VLVTVFDETMLLDAYALAAELRQRGLKVACYPQAAKLGKQFKFADRIGARVAVVLGPDEQARGEVTVKDLRSRVQQAVPRQDAGQVIRELLDTPSSS